MTEVVATGLDELRGSVQGAVIDRNAPDYDARARSTTR